MDYYNITFLSLFGISIILYLLFYFLKFRIPTIIFAALQIPFLYCASFSFLVTHLPDSYYSTIFLSMIFALATIGHVFAHLDKKRFLISSQILFFCSCSIWLYKTCSIFLFRHIPVWTCIIPISIFVLSFTLTMIFSKKQSIAFYPTAILIFAVSSFLIYAQILSTYYYPFLYSVMGLTGAVILHFFIIFYVLNEKRFRISFTPILNHFIFLSVLILVPLSSILIFL